MHPLSAGATSAAFFDANLLHNRLFLVKSIRIRIHVLIMKIWRAWIVLRRRRLQVSFFQRPRIRTRRLPPPSAFAASGFALKKVTLPRVIWMYWDRGRDVAPQIVQCLMNRWSLVNPSWDVRVLSDDTLAEYLSDYDSLLLRKRRGEISVQMLADWIRLRLLDHHGGVWADASTICLRPLDEWLHSYTVTGFFAPANPDVDRRISNWFLASEPNAPVIKNWLIAFDEAIHLYKRNPHYYIAHIMFDIALRQAPDARLQYEYMPSYPSALMHFMQVLDLCHLSEDRTSLLRQSIPVAKLDLGSLTEAGTNTFCDIVGTLNDNLHT